MESIRLEFLVALEFPVRQYRQLHPTNRVSTPIQKKKRLVRIATHIRLPIRFLSGIKLSTARESNRYRKLSTCTNLLFHNLAANDRADLRVRVVVFHHSTGTVHSRAVDLTVDTIVF
jgi:hypothetical protein